MSRKESELRIFDSDLRNPPLVATFSCFTRWAKDWRSSSWDDRTTIGVAGKGQPCHILGRFLGRPTPTLTQSSSSSSLTSSNAFCDAAVAQRPALKKKKSNGQLFWVATLAAGWLRKAWRRREQRHRRRRRRRTHFVTRSLVSVWRARASRGFIFDRDKILDFFEDLNFLFRGFFRFDRNHISPDLKNPSKFSRIFQSLPSMFQFNNIESKTLSINLKYSDVLSDLFFYPPLSFWETLYPSYPHLWFLLEGSFNNQLNSFVDFVFVDSYPLQQRPSPRGAQ